MTAESGLEGSIRARLGARSVVLVGIMGAGKSSVGRRLAQRLGMPFVDADDEIEAAAQRSIAEIFEAFGEAYFRDGERRVIARLLAEGPHVLATGGGAYMNEETREAIARDGVSVWLKADFEVVMNRVRRKSHRPLLQQADPEAVMRDLIAVRYPVYGLADITVQSRDVPHETIVEEILVALDAALPAGGGDQNEGVDKDRDEGKTA
ncbi:MAG: shikimate kinase [Hyphomicrobiales bacterium]